MNHFEDDTELFAAMHSRLFTAVVGDILDTMGLQHQFLPPQIRALRDDMVAVGRAMPVLEADFFAAAETSGNSAFSAKPFGLMFHALDNLKPNEIYVCTGGSPTYARWCGVELTPQDGAMVYVPEGCAHGYLTLQDDTELVYLTSAPYASGSARGVRHDDAAFKIHWPAPVRLLSDADRQWPDHQPADAVVLPGA